MCIHPNTVDYRLRRITELTGIDATQPRGIHHLTAALAAQRAELS
jgi:DNA-binding PucR family transcriptional regulator